MAGLTTAWELSAGDWRAGLDSITVVQRGWRLGGKGASSRDPACEATPAPSLVTVIVGRVLVGCTFEVPSPLGNCWRRNLQSSLLRGHFVYRPLPAHSSSMKNPG